MKKEIDINKYYKRNIDEQLLIWANNEKDKTIALVSGARRIGKTYSLKFLGKTKFDRYEIIDVQQLGDEIVKRLTDKNRNKENFIDYLLLVFNITESDINEKLLLIFDEIQEHNELKEAVSYFNSIFKCRFACTGSALWIDDTNGTRSTADYEKFLIYPFSFKDFLKIIGEGIDLYEKEKEAFNKRVNKDCDQKLFKLLRLYMVVGGMPQSIQHYLDNKVSLNVFSTLHNSMKTNIITTYENDLERHSRRLNMRLSNLYLSIRTDIGRWRDTDGLLPLYRKLENMNIVIIARNILNVNRKLSLSIDESFIKPFLLDVGVLFYYLCDSQNPLIVQSYCESFVNGKDKDDDGYIYENFVASTLVQRGYTPYFKVFDSLDENGENKIYELDFLLSGLKETIVLESKSGKNKEHKSLEIGLSKFSKLKSSYVLAKSYHFDKDNIHRGPHSIPFYALEFLLEE